MIDNLVIGALGVGVGFGAGMWATARCAIRETMAGFSFLSAVSEVRAVSSHDIWLAFDPHQRAERERQRSILERRARDSRRALDDTPPG